MAARAIWKGVIRFGKTSLPVKLYSAVHPQGLRFHQFQEGTNARVRNKRVSEKTGKEVPYEDIVKGYEVKKGQYVMVDPDELAEFAPRSTRTIEIEDFVDLDEIDPIYFERTYYLAPSGDGATKAYALLLKAMEDKQKKLTADSDVAKKAATASETPFAAAAFSPDNLEVAIAGADKLIHTYSAETGQSLDVLAGSAAKGDRDVAACRLDCLHLRQDRRAVGQSIVGDRACALPADALVGAEHECERKVLDSGCRGDGNPTGTRAYGGGGCRRWTRRSARVSAVFGVRSPKVRA